MRTEVCGALLEAVAVLIRAATSPCTGFTILKQLWHCSCLNILHLGLRSCNFMIK